jgi:hypothetical protein
VKTKTFLLLCIMLGFTKGEVTAQGNQSHWEASYNVYIPCAAEMASGILTLHQVVITNKNGRITKFHLQPQGGELIGASTGTVYRAIFLIQEMGPAIGSEDVLSHTWMDSYNLVGKDGVHYRMQVIYHITRNANGDDTAIIDNSTVVCD